MQVRVTVVGPSLDTKTDVVVECDPRDTAGRVLDLISQRLGMVGDPLVDGAPLAGDQPVGSSPLRNGAILDYAGGVATGPRKGRPDLVLRVLAGPDSGTSRPLRPGEDVTIGRGRSNKLVLTDPEVSATHATLVVRGELTLVDNDSSNGVVVDGEEVASAKVSEGSRIQLGGSVLTIERPVQVRLPVEPDGEGRWLVNRGAPRRAASSPVPVEVPRPPADDDDGGHSLWRLGILMGAPMIMGTVFVLLTGQLRFLVFGFMGPLLAGGNWWLESARTTRRKRKREATYQRALEAAERKLQLNADKESERLHSEWPSPAALLDAVHLPGPLLWSRQAGDDNWLRLRLGTQDVEITTGITDRERSALEESALELPTLTGAPDGVSLAEHPVVGIAGPGSAGALAWAALQCAALHSPDELGIYVFGDRTEQHAWLRWLPHATVAWTREQGEQLVKYLGALLDRAEQRHTGHARSALAVHSVVILLGWHAHPLRDTLRELIKRGRSVGMAFLCAEDDHRRLPPDCRTQLRLDESGTATLIADRETVIQPDLVSGTAAEQAARALAPLWPVASRAAAAFPTLVTHDDLVTQKPTLDSVRAGWRLDAPQTSVPIGRDANGVVEVDLVEDGPHGLVAGTTGSGKTELLLALLVGLARQNPPDRLNFFFIDYKGGESFQSLGDLPHTVGTVTNLDEARARRALESLNYELERRQRLLNPTDAEQTRIKDFSDYVKFQRSHPDLPVLTRLVVVVDEYAQLMLAMPDIGQEFTRIAQIGRTLGVNVILAMQSPTGVVNHHIRANMDLHMVMRVREASESIDMIGRIDAALISKRTKGRGFVQAGDETPSEVQVAWMRQPVSGRRSPALRVVPLAWYEIDVPEKGKADDEVGPTVVGELVSVISDAAKAEGRVAPHRPYLEPLPTTVLLSALTSRRHHITVGLQDLPAEPAQRTLTVPLGSDHVWLIGGPGSGRTTALRSMAVSAAQGGNVHLHVIDGGHQLRRLSDLPGCGVWVGPMDERVDRLLDRLASIVRQRQSALAQRDLASVADWWRIDPASAPAPILLLIDGGIATSLAPNVNVAEQRRDKLRQLLQAGRSAGLTVVLASDESGGYGIAEYFNLKAVLRLNATHKLDIPGLPTKLIAGLPPGRAIWVQDKTEVQMPLLAPDPSGTAQTEALAAQAAALRATATPDDSLLRLDLLPDSESYDHAVRQYPAPNGGIAALLGVGGDRLTGLWTQVPAGHSVAIAGQQRTERSKAVAAVAASLAATGASVVLVTPTGTSPAGGQAAARGVRLVVPDDLGAALADADVVALDGVKLDQSHVRVLIDSLNANRLRLVTAAAAEDYVAVGESLLREAVKRAVAKVVICPQQTSHGSNLGISLDRTQLFAEPPLRAMVEVEGELVRAQVPDLSA